MKITDYHAKLLARGFADNDQLKTNAAKIFASKGIEKFETV